MKSPPLTLIEHIARSQQDFPEATGSFSALMQAIALASKAISREVNRAGLGDLIGSAGRKNVQGEEVARLDEYSNETLVSVLRRCGGVCAIGSEELAVPIRLPTRDELAEYAVVFDPLDGSSNIDLAIPVGTIFGIYRRTSSAGGLGSEADLLQPATSLVAAGYALYGSSTVFVYSTGRGVHGFTLHPSLGEFMLSHPDIRVPPLGKTYSANLGNRDKWDPGVQRAIDAMEGRVDGHPRRSLRYVGSLVGDAHRTLLRGGLFCYPGEVAKPEGKLRLLYEGGPFGFLFENAGGAASDGTGSVVERIPKSLHERTPLVLGGRDDVELFHSLAR